MTQVLYWGEGPTDRAVAKVLISSCNGTPGPDYSGRSTAVGGKANLDRRLRGYNCAAAREPFLVLRDFDRDATCPAALASEKLPEPERFMCFRIVVPEIESWIMGDTETFAEWLQIPARNIPDRLEALVDAKAILLRLIERGRNRSLKADMLPRRGSGRKEGPLYASRLIEFISTTWSPIRAAERVPSLERALLRLMQKINDAREE